MIHPSVPFFALGCNASSELCIIESGHFRRFCILNVYQAVTPNIHLGLPILRLLPLPFSIVHNFSQPRVNTFIHVLIPPGSRSTFVVDIVPPEALDLRPS